MASYRGGSSPDGHTHKTVTCKRCGKVGLAWAQNKAGKWYLVETTYPAGDPEVGHGYFKANYHKCTAAQEN